MGVKITDEMIEGARKTQEKFGIPVSITLAQIALESGGNYEGGLSGLASKAKNLFGIKATDSWAGDIYKAKTYEYGSAGKYQITAKFKKYNSYTESIYDHGELLNSEHYQKNLASAKNYKEYAKGLQKSGYATAPNYAEKLIEIIEQNDFAKYDSESYSGTKSTDGGEDTKNFVEGLGKKIAVGLIGITLVILAVLFLVGAFDLKPNIGDSKT